jgi:hypothetical protein
LKLFFLLLLIYYLKDQALNGNIEIDNQNQILLSMKVDLENQLAYKTEQFDELQIEYNDLKVAYLP